MRSRCWIGWFLAASVGLAGCDRAPPKTPKQTLVRTQVVRFAEDGPHTVVSGSIQSDVLSDLSFRSGGRIAKRNVDVGARVAADDVLATLEPGEQKANLDAAAASVDSAESAVKKAAASFARQRILLADGFTTRKSYDQAEETLRTSEGTLESARAQLATNQDQLAQAVLRAGAPGVITARNAEAGQVVNAAQSIFTLAREGTQLAVFDVQEAALAERDAEHPRVRVALMSDPSIQVDGDILEVSPSVDQATGTMRVKVALRTPTPAMALGSPVTGAIRLKSRKTVELPWQALTTQSNRPAVWVLDPRTGAVAVRPVSVDAYKTGVVLVSEGLADGEVVVTAGTKFLRQDQIVAIAEGDAK